MHSVFTAYDSGYRQIHKGSAAAGDEGNFPLDDIIFCLQIRTLGAHFVASFMMYLAFIYGLIL